MAFSPQTSEAMATMQGVEKAVSSIGVATGLAGQSGEALQGIVEVITATADQVNAIAAASEEQSAASEEINRSIAEVNELSRGTAEAMVAARDEVVRLMVWEICKPLNDCRAEFDRTVDYIRATVDALKDLDRASSRFVIENGIYAQIRRAPLGPVLCMVFQSYALFPHLTVRENILFGLKVRKVPEADQARRLDNAVDILGLSGLLERKPSALSGGQQQRVALGRALVAEASVCLMDEPLSNLDAKLRLEMRREIRDLQQRLGMTMVYVTHDQTEAMSMADTIILMQSGGIVQNDGPESMYCRPATTFAASFIGTPPMNLLDVERHEGRLCISGDPTCGVPGDFGGPCTLGVRPEHLQVSDDGPWMAEVRSMVLLAFLGLAAFVQFGIIEKRVHYR